MRQQHDTNPGLTSNSSRSSASTASRRASDSSNNLGLGTSPHPPTAFANYASLANFANGSAYTTAGAPHLKPLGRPLELITERTSLAASSSDQRDSLSISHGYSQSELSHDSSVPPDMRSIPFPSLLAAAPTTDYESDGGYISDSARKSKKTLRWRKKSGAKDAKKKESKESEYESEGGYLSEKSKSKLKAKKQSKKEKGDKDSEALLATVSAALAGERA